VGADEATETRCSSTEPEGMQGNNPGFGGLQRVRMGQGPGGGGATRNVGWGGVGVGKIGRGGMMGVRKAHQEPYPAGNRS
jgi:hypothetical protein